jgi:hypothetical protein
MEKASTKRMPLKYDVKVEIHLSMVPTIVRPKAVFTRPCLFEFLRETRKFVARVIIWSSMKRSTIEQIIEYLFQDLPWPYEILGRGYCASVERGVGSGVFESREQELLSEFDKYQNSTKNRNFDGNFLPNTLFLVKIGTYYRGCRRLFNPL